MTIRRGAAHLLLLTALLPGCQGEDHPQAAAASHLASDWQGPAAADGTRAYAIDWSCEPKRFDSSAEDNIFMQEEYCEWHTVEGPQGTKACQFTTSFDNTRPFFLNSRGLTGINSIPAAQGLRDQCAEAAVRRRRAGKSVGHNCAEVGDGGCVPDRNSDPEICDKVRYMAGQKFDGQLAFSIDQMPRDGASYSKLPLMRFGLLAELPKGCSYSRTDHTEVTCEVTPETTCFSLAGQLRTGIRVLTKAVIK